jgi:hypothetical protein
MLSPGEIAKIRVEITRLEKDREKCNAMRHPKTDRRLD